MDCEARGLCDEHGEPSCEFGEAKRGEIRRGAEVDDNAYRDGSGSGWR